MHFLSFSKAALPRGQGLATITVSGHLTVTAGPCCVSGWSEVPPPPRPHYLCTDLYKLSLALIFLIQYCDLSNAV